MKLTLTILGWDVLTLTIGEHDTDTPTEVRHSIGFATADLAERAPAGWIPDEHYR